MESGPLGKCRWNASRSYQPGADGRLFSSARDINGGLFRLTYDNEGEAELEGYH
jgi:hypothetical protein